MTTLTKEILITFGVLIFLMSLFSHEFGTDRFGEANFKHYIDWRYVLFDKDYIKSFLVFVGVAVYVSLFGWSVLEIIFYYV